MSTDQQPQETLPSTNVLAVLPDAPKIVAFLQSKHEKAVELLREISAIETDADYAQTEELLVTIKQLYDKMSAKRKLLTDPIKDAIAGIMVYENAINYTAKTDNEYNRVRGLLDAFNQAKLEAKKKSEQEAKLVAERMKYRADYLFKISESLISMVNGKVKNIIQNTSAWAAKLTLEDIDRKMDALRNSEPIFKEEYYDECFRLWGAKPHLADKTLEAKWLEEFKKELPYANYQAKFAEAVAPIKNEYLAGIDEMKKKLKAIKDAADEKAKADLLAEQEAARKAKEEQDIAEANAKRDQDMKTIGEQKEIEHYNADFTEQAMTADQEAGPTKKVATFADETMWLNPFLKVVAKVAASKKFKGIMAKDGYIPEVKKWMEFYAQYVGEPIDGIVLDKQAKTIVRAK